jgi:hypothetical protein
MIKRLVLIGAAVAAVAGLFPARAATALSPGFKAIASSGGSGVAAGHTGYGPGWIGLTFGTGGAPHGPIIGYLFHSGVAAAHGNDHFDVTRYRTRPAASVRTPFAAGYAYGHFNGCAWSYLDAHGKELSAQGPNHRTCSPPNHTTKIFCTNTAADRLCNNGHSKAEPEAGVWKHPGNHLATIRSGGCDVVGNVGATAIYSGGVAHRANPIAHISTGIVQVRYVTKRGGWVMGNLEPDHGPQFPFGIQWGFFPRGCLH